jgi:pyrroloquinoline quinone biosynthesis protein B
LAQSAARLTAVVLGSAAGGGFPQWNCRCAVCCLAWDGDPRVRPRTQTGLAISADGAQWVLLNASPDLGAQIRAAKMLHPRETPRHSPIAAVVLTGGEVDQTAGLLNLRERQAFDLYATAPTLAMIEANPMFEVLSDDLVKRRTASFGAPFDIGGLEIELFAVPGKVPLYKESEGVLADTTAGVEVRSHDARLVFIPGAAAITDDIRERAVRADAVLFDATVFHDDEMIRAGTGSKTGQRMGHMPLDGAEGSLRALAGLANRRILIHINNTNPILIDGSPERRRVEGEGWELAEDGLEIVL